MPQSYLLLSNHIGVYIPQKFVEEYQEYMVNPFLYISYIGELLPTPIFQDMGIVERGPEQEYYWDAWQSILNNTILYYKGTRYYLQHDDDLWAIPINEQHLID